MYLTSGGFAGEAKVDELDVTLGGNEDVLWLWVRGKEGGRVRSSKKGREGGRVEGREGAYLDVAVNDAVLVQKFDG